jgi:outer membrane protein OmpA-like peptidoglycan-associated protein
LKKIPPQAEITKEEKSKPIVLKNIFFETASAVLLDASLFELNKLFRLLDENPSMKIQLNGHTDDVGSDEDNLLLSENRAKAVYNFLIEKGIAQERLAYRGFGESQPIDTNETDEGRQNNRRTEFEIIK